MDYKQEIIKEIEGMPKEMLPRVHRLVHLLNYKREKLEEVLREAEKLKTERANWTDEQYIDRLLQVLEDLRQEAIEKGVAIERDEEAAIGS
ncbi:MAG: hypothetical protein ACE5OR_08190 [bacterium]